jgi:hypothetical protein
VPEAKSLRRGRLAAAGGLLLTVGLMAVQLGAWNEVGKNVDAVTVVLLLLAVVLLFGFAAPSATRSFLERMTTLKLPGGVELGLEAASRAERVQGRLSESLEDLPPREDDVTTRQRPLEGDAREQFQKVRARLEMRLRFVHTVVFGESKATEGNYPRIVERIEAEHLLSPEELALVRDLLGRAEDEIEQLPFELRAEFLDASWLFAVRFATLTHERLVRKRLTEHRWDLVDFQQDRKHRPDFLAYREKVWLLIAARVEPGKLESTRERLAEKPPPFEAVPVIALPDLRDLDPDGKFRRVDVVHLRDLLERDPESWADPDRPGWD